MVSLGSQDYPLPATVARITPEGTVMHMLDAYAREDVRDLAETLTPDFRYVSDDRDFVAAAPAGFSRDDEIASDRHLFADAVSIHIHVASWSGCWWISSREVPLGGRMILKGVALTIRLRSGEWIRTEPTTQEFTIVRTDLPPTGPPATDPIYLVSRWSERTPGLAVADSSERSAPPSGEPDSTMLASHEAAGAPTVLAVQPRESPARGVLRLDLALPSREPARVEMYDVAGRRVKAWEIPSGPARSLTLEAGTAGALPAGVYWLRLAQGARVAKSHIVLLK